MDRQQQCPSSKIRKLGLSHATDCPPYVILVSVNLGEVSAFG